MTGLYWITDEVLAVAGFALSLVVVVIYLGVYRKRRNSFTLSLTGLGMMFGAQNVALLFTYAYLSARYGSDVAIPLMVVNILEIAGLLTLARVTVA